MEYEKSASVTWSGITLLSMHFGYDMLLLSSLVVIAIGIVSIKWHWKLSKKI